MDVVERARRAAADADAGASEIVARLLPVFADAVAAGAEVTIAAARAACAAQPAMAPLWNVAAAAVADHERPGRYARVRAEIERAPAALTRVAAAGLADAIADRRGRTVLTVSWSASVAAALGEVARGGTVRVICGEGRPRMEGRRMATVLAAAGAAVTVVTDAALTAGLGDAALVVTGADALTSDAWINKVGTSGLAAAAHRAGVPVHVVATRDKALAPALAARLVLPEAPAAAVWPDAPPGIRLGNPVFEPTAAELATYYWTEAGPLTAEDLSTLVRRFEEDAHILLKYLA